MSNKMQVVRHCFYILTSPNLFDVYTYASRHQLGAVIIQEQRSMAFYLREYQPPQRELLAILETIKEFINGHHIRVYTDHKNLSYKIV
jgi:RNase H-like domain found in reverse transcriptase